jgi:hypothetical protein
MIEAGDQRPATRDQEAREPQEHRLKPMLRGWLKFMVRESVLVTLSSPEDYLWCMA